MMLGYLHALTRLTSPGSIKKSCSDEKTGKLYSQQSEEKILFNFKMLLMKPGINHQRDNVLILSQYRHK